MTASPRIRWAALVMGILLPCAGCTVMNGRMPWVSDKPPAQSEPDTIDDKWAFVGKEARGHRPLEDEKDPFKPFLMSDEARAIERNLGYK